jgi:GH15 family glucan-1,4-alpha-glucosidase
LTSRIEQYALIGDTQTAALVADDGSVDWLCAPRFDSASIFAALLGEPGHGRWLLAPAAGGRATRRRYRDGTLVLETEFDTPEGTVRVVDCMPIRDQHVDLIRLVEGVRGRVTMKTEFVIRFDYGSLVPWVRQGEGELYAVGGANAVVLHTPVRLRGQNLCHEGEFTVAAGDTIPFTLTWYRSHEQAPRARDPRRAVARTTHWWETWSSRSKYHGKWPELVNRSAVTLKALTYAPTGGIVAAPTTSLPESIGSVRNWDYRYCWLRDATFSLLALMELGYAREAHSWRDWLLRAVAGSPQQMQIMYGAAGERMLPELELDWLPGYEDSAPVRIGNAAARQFQLDVYGEVADVLHRARDVGLPGIEMWPVEEALLRFLEDGWRQPDEGIWEVRGPRRHFTHSKVMAWVAFDRGVKSIEALQFDWDLAKYAALRDEVHHEICEQGVDPDRGVFVQSYGSKDLDASLLMIPLVEFLPATDPRVVATVEAIQDELVVDGFVRRYRTESDVDGLPRGEGMFLPCSFWLADNLALMGRSDEAHRLFERLVAICNDVGLLSEEYDPDAGRMLGNFPQAMTHVALINTARILDQDGQPGEIDTASQHPNAPGATA